MALDASIDGLRSAARFPLKYGYSTVGRVVALGPGVDEGWRGRLAFCLHPHESRFLARADELYPVPDGVSAEDAALYPSAETALTLVMDGRPMIGEHVAVFGQGIVGLMVTALLARFPLASLVTFDLHPLRRRLSRELGADDAVDPRSARAAAAARRDCDLAYELSGDPATLDDAIAVTGFCGRVVIGSWYGERAAPVALGGAFHRSRMRLICSQVSTIDPALSGRWSMQRRRDAAWDAARADRPGAARHASLPVRCGARRVCAARSSPGRGRAGAADLRGLMRVGLVIYGSLDTLTGGYLYDRKLAEHLTAHGDDVEVVSLPWRNYARHLSDNASRALARRLDGGRFDVLVQDELNHPSLVLTNRRLADRSACPIVAMVHVLRVDELAGSRLRPLYAAAERRYLGGVDGAVFCCDATRASAERLVGRPLRGTVAHPCADHLDAPATEAAIRGRASRGGPLRVVSVANVVPRKGLLVLVEALARLPRDRWQLTVVGSLAMDRAYVRRVRRRVARLGLQDSVRLIGAVANRDVAAHLSDSDVLVVPSSFEGLAIAYLEAMRVGLPVIASTAGGAGEVIDDGSEGWLVAPGDVQTLASRLGRLCEDRELLARMGLAARGRAERHPRWDESLGHVRAFLRTVVSEHRPTGSEVAA